jgi:16S rRNA C1402 (ribose-2'-O) methylase RsmI
MYMIMVRGMGDNGFTVMIIVGASVVIMALIILLIKAEVIPVLY